MRSALNETMNPAAADSVREAADRRQRAADRDKRLRNTLLQQELRNQLSDLLAGEAADRANILADAMREWINILYGGGSGAGQTRGRGAGPAPRTVQEMLRDIVEEEAADRNQLVAEEANRRALYRREDVTVREMIDRSELEVLEMDERDDIMTALLNENRNQLERRINEREQIANLVGEEDFYRRNIVQDEQDAFDVLTELFAQELRDLLSRPSEDEDEDESPRRRRMSTQRSAKPFHYMTFSPEDMDYAPSAVLALEGMLGCAVNKNLEVVSISRLLPKVTDDDLQFQAGDMILDVAGHSLHSVSHLREVLSNRAVQIQEEAFEEFPDVPDDDLTTNPALQKYIEVLCEHHNYLVQVLRGCDIYQIIVKS
ncbi:hypothetical protein AGDE_13864 [Angomonas deanei]|nr:hypothetical protein AGDE_13864 [Angomonas deanei]|eukprot:EPY21659.1 hypothetical protein AGDE_13864 [Angomonas deanei]